MNGSSVVAILILAVFLGGVTLGVVVAASVGSRLEDRRFTLSGPAPGITARGARRLNGFGGSGGHFRPRGYGR